MAHFTTGDRHKNEVNFYKKHFRRDAWRSYYHDQKKFTKRALERKRKEQERRQFINDD